MSVLELPSQSGVLSPLSPFVPGPKDQGLVEGLGGTEGGNVLTVTYMGDERAVVESSGGRTFVVDQRVNIGREEAQFCPIELIATSRGA